MLRIKNLEKSFTNSDKEKFDVINISDFLLNDNEHIAITGESGTGKSTFLNLVSGILEADSGEIFLNDIDIAKLSESRRDIFRAKNMGYIFQTFNLLQGFTALENVMIGMMFAGKTDKQRSENALRRVGLVNRMNNKPSELSVGEQQRVGIARAIVNHPNLLLADEPTANLDNTNSDSVIELIKDLCDENRISLILVSHEKEVISKFPNVKSFSQINRIE